MVFLLFMLLMLFLFPWLLYPFLLFILLNIFILPYSFTLQSLITLFSAPGQLIKIATNRKLRTNHALEHATINVIEEIYGQRNLSGLARESGFVICGAADPRIIREAAEVGLNRLKRGESSLAIHNRCGTSMTVANLISSLVFILLLFQTGYFSIWNVLIALALANLMGPFMGRFVQRHLTTLTDVDDMEITGIEFNRPTAGGFFLLQSSFPSEFFVHTGQIRRVEVL